MLFDVFVHHIPTLGIPAREDAQPSLDAPAPIEETFLIEHNAQISEMLKSHLKKFILRSKVKLKDVSSEWRVDVAFPSQIGSSFDYQQLKDESGLRADTRAANASLGKRFLRYSGDREAPPEELFQRFWPEQSRIENEWRQQQPKPEIVQEAYYHLHRIRLGVAEGPVDLITGSTIPLESNMDYMGASKSPCDFVEL